MACHQSHNIPWQALVECVELEAVLRRQAIGPNSPNYTLTIMPVKKKKFEHFIRCFDRVVQEFVVTEQTKFASTETDPEIPLYSSNPDSFLPPGNLQRLSHWRELQDRNELVGHVEAAQIVKVLIGTNNLSPLIRLARAKVDLNKLAWMSYSNFFHYGSKRILEDALQLYLHTNLEIASGNISTAHPEGFRPNFAEFIQFDILPTSDYDTQVELFFRPCFDPSTEVFVGATAEDRAQKARDLAHEAFRMIYQYLLIAKECGQPINFQSELTRCLTGSFDLNLLVNSA